MADARENIQAVIDEEDAAWNAGDAVAYSARVLPDIVFTNIRGQQFAGREGFEKQHAFVFRTLYAGTHLRQTIAHLRFLTDDIAIVDTDCELSGAKALPPGYASADGVLRTRLLQVMMRGPDGWRIASYHNVVFNPPPGA
jgi:uncharacterized protein (TIGR02246 family)